MSILNCSCQHRGQDKIHGRGRRVHNPVTKSGGWRCTVCGKEKGDADGKKYR